MSYLNHWKSLICASLLVTIGACTDSRDALAPTTRPAASGAPTNGTPTNLSRAVLDCVATVGAGNAPSVSCGPASGSSSRAGQHSDLAYDVIVGRQNVDVSVALSNFSYSAATGIFQFNATVKNLLNQPLGTTDGVHAAANQTRIFFYTLPAVTHGSGTVTVNNPDGQGFFTQSQPQPYYQYTSPIAPLGTSNAKTWQLKITSGVTGFTFSVEIDAPLPAEKSIRRWVVLRQGLTPDSLTSVWQRSASDVWAVGMGGAVLQYSGTSWAAVTPSGSVVNYRAVSGNPGATVASVWVVGDNGATAHDTNSTWTTVRSSTRSDLYGVWVASAGNVFAVGARGTILHYTSGDWDAMTAPEGLGSTNLRAVWGTDATHVWAAGDNGTIIFYNGTSWSTQTSHTSQPLAAVWGTSATNVFTVGANGTILSYNGTTWSSQSSGSTAALTGVGGSAATDMWAVGSAGTTLHYNGATWSVIGPHMGIPLSAVTSGTTTPWGVGAEGSLVAYNGGVWQVSLQSGLSLNSVWARSANDVWISTLGTVLHYDGTNWSNAYVSPGDSMTSIVGVGASADTLYTVGATGSFGVYSNGSWAPLQVGLDLYSVWGTSSSNVYSGAASGVVGRYTSGSFTQMSLPTSSAVQCVWGSSAAKVFAVTANGAIYSYGGSGQSWSSMSVPGSGGNFKSVFGSSASDVYAAGSSGTILHYTGSGSWAAQTSGTSVTLRGLWADAAPSGYTADAYAVGDQGTVQHYNGSAWLNMPTPASTPTLRAIYGTAATNLYVVGDQGTVLLGTQ